MSRKKDPKVKLKVRASDVDLIVRALDLLWDTVRTTSAVEHLRREGPIATAIDDEMRRASWLEERLGNAAEAARAEAARVEREAASA